MQEAKINLGKVVRIARKRKRITQDYLAEKVGVQPRTILEIENGRGNPRFENLFVMVRLLDIAPNDIFNYDCGLAQDTEQLFQELSSFSEEEQRMAAAAARAVLQQIRYLCIVGRLAAEICIADPLRKEAKAAIEALHACGISKVVMMAGDNRKTAQAVAREVGVDQFYADVLPEDKASFIRQEKSAGRKVIMIGDGVNDTPALSEADVGIAINTGAAIAREIADVTIASEDLFELVTLRKISQALMNRIHRNYRFIVGFNCMLIALGVAGVIQPTTSALLHNASTLGISLDSMTDLLDKEKECKEPEA